jgi:hypothetical protein
MLDGRTGGHPRRGRETDEQDRSDRKRGQPSHGSASQVRTIPAALDAAAGSAARSYGTGPRESSPFRTPEPRRARIAVHEDNVAQAPIWISPFQSV